MNIVRLQHIIPRYYLERFCENEHIYIFDKIQKKDILKTSQKLLHPIIIQVKKNKC